MAIDFPNTPTAGQLYTVGNRSWRWDGTAWRGYSNPTMYRQDTAPSSPFVGDQWFETDSGRWFVYYDSYWVEIGSAGRVTVSANDLTGPTLASNVTGSSLTSVGTLGSLTVTGDVTVDTNTLKVDSTNNRVGIGTASPQYALDVQSSQTLGMRVTHTGAGNAFLVEDSATTDSTPFVIDAAGKVGIGTSSPAEVLDVRGSIMARATTTSDGVQIVGSGNGSSTYHVTILPASLTGFRTLTLPDETGTVALTSNVGLVLVKSQAVTGTASSVVVTNAFSAAYDNYEIIYTGTSLAGTDAQFICQLGSATTNYRTTLLYNVNSTTPVGATTNAQAGFPWVGGGSGNDAYAHFKLFTPFLTRHTRMETSSYIAWPDAGFGHASGVHSAFTSFTDFTLSSTAGSFTGGTIRVYGYRN